MKASELRIGNYIQEPYDGQPEQVYDIITGDGAGVGDDNVSINGEFSEFGEHFKPVPLTEEWLVRFGFDNKDDDGQELSCYFKDGFDLIGINVTPDKLGLISEYTLDLYQDIIDEDGEYAAEHAITLNSELKYVHQLQNLYFALTGEELEYNGI